MGNHCEKLSLQRSIALTRLCDGAANTNQFPVEVMSVFTVVTAIFDDSGMLLEGLSDLEIAEIGGTRILLAGSQENSAVTSFTLSGAGLPSAADELTTTATSGTQSLSALGSYVINGVTYGLTLGLYDDNYGLYSIDAAGNLSFEASLTDGIGSFAQGQVAEVITVGGNTFVLSSSFGRTGFNLFQAGMDGTLTKLSTINDGAGDFLSDVSAFAHATLHGQDFAFAAGSFDAGIHTYTISSAGDLTQTDRMGPYEFTPFGAITELAAIDAGARFFLISAASATSSLSVYRVSQGGNLKEVENVWDGLDTLLGGLSAMEVFQDQGRNFVVAGGTEGGLSVFELTWQGNLRLIETFEDTAGTTLNGISDIEVDVTSGAALIYVSSDVEDGLTVLSMDTTRSGQVIEGGPVKDTLVGTDGDDVIWGYGKSDLLFGGAGDDRLIDGRGRDRMTGGEGADIFEFVPDTRTDWILDFEQGIDRLDFSGFDGLYHISTLDIQARLGGGVIFAASEIFRIETLSGNPIDVAAFTNDDFIFG